MEQEKEEARLKKNAQIAKTKKETIERRSKMKCQVFHLKIDSNNASIKAKNELKQVFNQAKWLRNHVLSLDSFNDYSKKPSVPVKTPTGYEERELNLLGSQVEQVVVSQLKTDARNLKAKKDKGHKIGKLKFTRQVKSINLKQVGSTYRFNKKLNKVKIQGLPYWYRVMGVRQFESLEEYELANAKLLSRAGSYYLAVTVYSKKEDTSEQKYPLESLGMDFGVKTAVTLSDEREYNHKIVETERLKRLQKKLSRQEKGSNNSMKTRLLIQKEYEKMRNQKNEIVNQLLAKLKKESQVIYYQDDNFNSWRKKHSKARGGKSIQHGILGRLKQKMLEDPEKFLKVDRYAPTTKTCVCGVKNESLTLNDRWFSCDSCGYRAPRDVHAANNMQYFYTPREPGSAPVERLSDLEKPKSSSKQNSAKQETVTLSV